MEIESATAKILEEIAWRRRQQGITQQRAEELSGVKQPVIARMEKGHTDPRLSTLLKVLAPLGLTLKVVPKD